MSKLQNFTLTTAISILGFSTINITNADASTLGSKLKLVTLAQSDRATAELLPNNPDYISTIAKADRDRIAQNDSVETGDEMIDALQERQEKIENLKELKNLQEQLDNTNLNNKKLEALQQTELNITNLEELQELEAIVNNGNLDNAEILDTLQDQGFNIENIEKLQKIQTILNADKSAISESSDSSRLSATMAFRMLTIGIPATILVFLVGMPFVKGIAGVFKDNIDEKFGKPKVPDGSIALHNKALKEITLIGNKAERINDDKFGNEEFILLIQIKIDIAKKTEGYPELSYRIELLKAAIIAQKSFLKLESTELRYRSRKQQEFYQYVAENLEEDIDKEAFAKKVKKKQIEVLPLITTDEGRDAIESYVKEIKNISQYDLGLKLLTLFKQYDLKDFSILKKVSDVVESLQGQDLLSPKNLVSLVLENYEAFEKLTPILGISEAESSPTTYARILQVIGLENRHGKAYLQFEQLVQLLKTWEKPDKTIKMVREEYTSNKYQIPSEFEQEIPGIDIYRKYAKYLPDL